MNYYVMCLNDSQVYGERDTYENAQRRAANLATKNIGRTYAVLDVLISYESKPKEVEMVITEVGKPDQ